jgi:hypothetical protein
MQKSILISLQYKRISFASGGQVTTSEWPVTNISVTINTTEQGDARFVRRNIIPEIERYE